MNGYVRTVESGGGGGDAFQDDLTEVCRLIGLNIRAGEYVDALQCIWSTPAGSTVSGTQHGGGGGSLNQISLDMNEYIVRVDGRSGIYIDQLTFTTNVGRKIGPFGGGGGDPFSLPNLNVGGFFGQSGDLLDAVGVFTPGQC